MATKKKSKQQRLNDFFDEVVNLTINHNVLHNNAVIYANRLGAALEKVDPDWWKGKNK